MTLSKRERLERLMHGERADRPGVALWRHWPGDDQDPVELARSTIAWQEQFDWDFVKVSPDSGFCVSGWGARSRWVGNNEGNREYTLHPIQNEADWYALQPQDPTAGRLGAQIRCLELVGEGLPKGTPFIQTVFSPTAQVKYLAGKDRILAEIRRHPDAVIHALEVITETTLRFLEAMRHTGVAGIFFALQLATPYELTAEEYKTFGRPYDLRILEAARELYWFNLLHLHGADAYFELVVDYPVPAINWHDRESEVSLAAARERFSGALVGGLRQWDTMLRGTPDDVRAEAADALAQTDGRGFILGTGCVTPVTAPLGNIRAVRQAVEA
ncbi:MAG: uroporphyrinogen decarboxylase [Caldilineae bacterium]|nr:MAG: uroporphyrinogen decarboxylase [Caldilineae bacterium]